MIYLTSMPISVLTFPSPNVVGDYMECNVLTWEGKVDKALPVCEKVFRKTPNRVTIHNLLLLAVSKGDKNLLEELERFLSKNGKKDNPLLWEVKAAKAYLSGDYETFSKYALKCFRNGFSDNFLVQAAVQTLRSYPDTELAAWVLFYLRKQRPDDPKLSEGLKKMLELLGDRATDLLRRFIRYDPRPEYYLWLGRRLLENGRFSEAVEVLEEGVERFPDNAELKDLLADAYLFNGEPGKIEQEGAPIDPNLLKESAKAFAKLNAIISNPKEREELIKVLSVFYSQSPQSVENALLSAYQAFWVKGVFLFGEVLKNVLKNPSEEDIPYLTLYWVEKMRINRSLDGDDERLLHQLEEKYPKNPLLKVVEAYNLTLKGENQKAKNLLRGVEEEELPVLLLPVYRALAYYYGLLSDKILKDIAPPPAGVVILYLEPLSTEKARRFADRYLKLHPTEDAYADIADSLFIAGDLEGALKYYREAALRFPDNPDFLNTYAYLLLLTEGKEKADEAIKLLQKALQMRPGEPAYLDSLGWAYFLKGDLKKAERYLKEALKKIPADPVVNYHYGVLLMEENKPCQALDYLKKALESVYENPFEPEPGIEKAIKNRLEEAKGKCSPKR